MPRPPAPVPPAANRLLAALPSAIRTSLLARLEPVDLPLAHLLVVPGARMQHVYFPTAGVVALLAQVDDHPPLAVGMVGNEGMVGISVVFGWRSTPVGAIVQVLQIAQHAVCSQFHRLEARLGCWLLMTYDRAPAEAWWLTQHFLAIL